MNPDPVSELYERNATVVMGAYTQCKNGTANVGWRCQMTVNNEPFLGWAQNKKTSKKSAAAKACLKLFDLHYNITVPNLPVINAACGDSD